MSIAQGKKTQYLYKRVRYAVISLPTLIHLSLSFYLAVSSSLLISLSPPLFLSEHHSHAEYSKEGIGVTMEDCQTMTVQLLRTWSQHKTYLIIWGTQRHGLFTAMPYF